MPSPRPDNRFEENDTEKPRPSAGLWKRWQRFWFAPVDPIGLRCIRFLLGCYLCAWLWGTMGRHVELFGLEGWFDARGYAEAALIPEESRPYFGWSPIYLASSPTLVHALFFGTMAVFAAMALGVAIRITGPLAWLGVVSFTSNPAMGYGGDVLLLILTFYVALGCLISGLRHPLNAASIAGGPNGFLDWPICRGRTFNRPSIGANLAMRLLQVHFAIAIVACGSFKLQIGEWWAGDALWFPLFHPENTSLAELSAWKMKSPRFLLSSIGIATYLTLAWQLAFPFLIWRKRWRPWMIAGALLGLLGCWFIYRLPTYGPVMLIATLSFLEPAGWRNILTRMPGLSALTQAGIQAESP